MGQRARAVSEFGKALAQAARRLNPTRAALLTLRAVKPPALRLRFKRQQQQQHQQQKQTQPRLALPTSAAATARMGWWYGAAEPVREAAEQALLDHYSTTPRQHKQVDVGGGAFVNTVAYNEDVLPPRAAPPSRTTDTAVDTVVGPVTVAGHATTAGSVFWRWWRWFEWRQPALATLASAPAMDSAAGNEEKAPSAGTVTAVSRPTIRDDDQDIGPASRAKEGERVGVVMTHGFGAGLAFFSKNIDTVADAARERQMAAYMLDWLGMGRSTRAPFPPLKNDGNMQDVEAAENYFVDSLERWRVNVGLDRMVLIGHSLGGYLSAIYTMRYPERVRKLILVSPAGLPTKPPGWDSPELNPWAQQRPWLFRAIKFMWENNYTPQSLVRGAGPLGRHLVQKAVNLRFHHLSETERALLCNYTYHITAAAGAGELAFNSILSFGAFARRPLEPLLPHSLKVPVAFIYGKYDWMDNTSAERTCKQACVPARVHYVSDGGHHMYFENPGGFNAILREEIASA